MILTQSEARKHIGKMIDSHRRMFGYYPMKIVERHGECYVKDATGTYTRLTDTANDPNARYYDFMYEEAHHEEKD